MLDATHFSIQHVVKPSFALCKKADSVAAHQDFSRARPSPAAPPPRPARVTSSPRVVTRGYLIASDGTLHRLAVTEVTQPTGMDLVFADSKHCSGYESLSVFCFASLCSWNYTHADSSQHTRRCGTAAIKTPHATQLLHSHEPTTARQPHVMFAVQTTLLHTEEDCLMLQRGR